MNAKVDVSKTLQFQPRARVKLMLFIGLALWVLGMLMAFSDDSRSRPFAFFAIPLGMVISGYHFRKLFREGKPELVLSTLGLYTRTPGSRDLFIPWSEVREVGSMDIKAGRHTIRGVTFVRVAERFYRETVEPDASVFGPDTTRFVKQGNFVNIAIPHGNLGVDARSLREAISARAYVYGNRSKPSAQT